MNSASFVVLPQAQYLALVALMHQQQSIVRLMPGTSTISDQLLRLQTQFQGLVVSLREEVVKLETRSNEYEAISRASNTAMDSLKSQISALRNNQLKLLAELSEAARHQQLFKTSTQKLKTQIKTLRAEIDRLTDENKRLLDDTSRLKLQNQQTVADFEHMISKMQQKHVKAIHKLRRERNIEDQLETELNELKKMQEALGMQGEM